MEVIQLSSPEDRLLTRQEASHYLGEFGIRRSPATLAKLFFMRSDSPPCVHHGRKPLYPRRLLLGLGRGPAHRRASLLQRARRYGKAVYAGA